MDTSKIEKMLTAMLRSQGNIHWIGGYACEQTAAGEMFVILYATSAAAQTKEEMTPICHVYGADFAKLPPSVAQQLDGQVSGRYVACPPFCVLTYDYETPLRREKRFSDVLEMPSAQGTKPMPPAPQTAAESLPNTDDLPPPPPPEEPHTAPPPPADKIEPPVVPETITTLNAALQQAFPNAAERQRHCDACLRKLGVASIRQVSQTAAEQWLAFLAQKIQAT